MDLVGRDRCGFGLEARCHRAAKNEPLTPIRVSDTPYDNLKERSPFEYANNIQSEM